jgi:hypothetical protein
MIFQVWTFIVYIFLPKLSFFQIFPSKKKALVGSDLLGQGRTWGGQMTLGEDREDNFDQGRTLVHHDPHRSEYLINFIP